jgi:WD40 repeat protein
LKNAHEEDITNLRHYLDKINNRDLILSISSSNNNVKMWDINNLEYLLTINNINRHGFTKSACILNFDNDLYIVTSNYSYSEVPEPIRLYNMEGYKII